ncbi:hypothetical protein M9H77_36316 [Catharanthus roseus]|uniref:Uncharacterized protein n=1 Tax=Catharanthus roseus TaxID=4058 RepID=A0ACB9ZSS0_CATRO|nr:hypothetical protein M9H77_36316 [Catharanthus roseus]
MKKNRVISFVSIASFDDDEVQRTKNFQFMNCFEEQNSNYKGGLKMLASLISHESGDLSPQNEISTTCNRLRRQGKLHGIFHHEHY